MDFTFWIEFCVVAYMIIIYYKIVCCFAMHYLHDIVIK